MLRFAASLAVLLLAGCMGSEPLLGILSPDAVDARYLSLRNSSRGYVVFRITLAGHAPLLTPTMPPGAEEHHELLAEYGTLCPESIRVEVAAYRRAHPEFSPLEDETLEPVAFAACAVDLVSSLHYGCTADPSWINLDSTISCSVLEVDENEGAIGLQAGWLPPQRQSGLQIADPPVSSPPPMFPLTGRLVDLNAAPMPGIEIRLPQLGASVYTDEQGRFSVLRPAGVYRVEPQLGGVEVSPALLRFSHFSPQEVPIEFIALTAGKPAAPEVNP